MEQRWCAGKIQKKLDGGQVRVAGRVITPPVYGRRGIFVDGLYFNEYIP